VKYINNWSDKSPQSIRQIGLWVVRLLVLVWIINQLTPIQSRAPLGPAQTVETTQDHVCVHTRLIDEVFEWKIQRSLELVREMGADTIVEFFPWAYLEPDENRFRWEQADKIIRHAENQGIRVIARLGFVPEWARPENIQADFTTLNYLPDESFADFAEFVATFSARYAGTVDHIIIWNEPNLAFEWGYRQVDPAGYVRLLQAVYEPAKQANPDVIILAGALAPTLEPLGSKNGLNDIIYLEQMYQAGAADYFDALAIHTYGFTLPPEDEPDFNALNFRRAELLHDLMLQYDDPAKPVYITESGWNDNIRWTKAVRPSERAIYTVNSFEWAKENWDWLEELCIWAFRYPAPTNAYPDNFTLVNPDFTRKPIYYAIQSYALGLERDDTLWLPPPASE